MKVIFIPDYRNLNSYQTNLSNSVSKKDVTVNFNLGSIIKYWKPDVIHIHWTFPYMMANSRLMTIIKSTGFICMLIMLRLFGIKIIWTVHNIIDHEGKFKSTELFFTKFLAKLSNKLIVHCQAAKLEVMKIYDKDDSSIIVIPHGNYIDKYKNTISNHDARNKLNVSEEDKVFLYFGQIRVYKGIPELISAFNKLGNKNVKLFIVGKLLDEDVAVKILSNRDDRIESVLTFVPDDDIQIYMNAADVVVLPFKDILTSGSAILAMSFGKPIIAPDIGCITDTIDNRGGFLYPIEKTENIGKIETGLFDAMQNVLNTDRTTLLNMGMHNFRLAEQFGWDKVGKRTYNLYQECLVGQIS